MIPRFNEHSLSLGLFYNQRENYYETLTGTRIDYYTNIDQIFAGPTDGQTNSGTAGGRRTFRICRYIEL